MHFDRNFLEKLSPDDLLRPNIFSFSFFFLFFPFYHRQVTLARTHGRGGGGEEGEEEGEEEKKMEKKWRKKKKEKSNMAYFLSALRVLEPVIAYVLLLLITTKFQLIFVDDDTRGRKRKKDRKGEKKKKEWRTEKQKEKKK